MTLLPIHVAAGGLAIVLGTIASLLAIRKSPIDPNVFGGFMTAYFVVTALTTVRPVSSWTRGINIVALTVAVGLALVDIAT